MKKVTDREIAEKQLRTIAAGKNERLADAAKKVLTDEKLLNRYIERRAERVSGKQIKKPEATKKSWLSFFKK